MYTTISEYITYCQDYENWLDLLDLMEPIRKKILQAQEESDFEADMQANKNKQLKISYY